MHALVLNSTDEIYKYSMIQCCHSYCSKTFKVSLYSLSGGHHGQTITLFKKLTRDNFCFSTNKETKLRLTELPMGDERFQGWPNFLECDMTFRPQMKVDQVNGACFIKICDKVNIFCSGASLWRYFSWIIELLDFMSLNPFKNNLCFCHVSYQTAFWRR